MCVCGGGSVIAVRLPGWRWKGGCLLFGEGGVDGDEQVMEGLPPYSRKPNAMKQKNAFPPNFIHSLDSTHMMLTALFCMR